MAHLYQHGDWIMTTILDPWLHPDQAWAQPKRSLPVVSHLFTVPAAFWCKISPTVTQSQILMLMRGMATLPQGNQELLVVRDKVGRPPGEFGVSKSIEWEIFPFSALTLLVGRQEGHPTCKKLAVGLLVMMIWLELCMTYSSHWHHHFHQPLLRITPANPGSPGKWPL